MEGFMKTKKLLVLSVLLLLSFLVLVEVGTHTKWLQVGDSPIASVGATTLEEELLEGEYVANRVLIKYLEPPMKLFYKAPDFGIGKVISYKLIQVPGTNQPSLLSFHANPVWYKAELESGTNLLDAIYALRQVPGVIHVEPDYVRTIQVDGEPEEVVDTINQTNDPLLNQQYYLSKINLSQTRNFLVSKGINPGGSRSIIVAVIDTGVDYTHADLAPNMWINPREIPGDGIDNDGNGYVDDIYGVSTVGNEWSHTGDPMDYHGHGTHVAGIIAAKGNNEIGIRGVADNVRIMAIKASGSSGIFNTSDIVEAINYAVQNGASVINMSFGGYARSTIEMEALEFAFNKAVLVASAGNQSLPNYPEPRIPGRSVYPAAYNFVIGVMASDENNRLAGFSNYDYFPQDSHEYEITAPGRQILSTLPNNKYAKWDGTSMSAPIVSGIAALLKSYFTDPSSHSSRFIMGQIIGTANIPVSIPVHIQPFTWWPSFALANSYNAFISVPKPKLTVFEHYIFDGPEVSSQNNGNGVIDSGETVDLAFILRNHWGKADNVLVKIDTITPGGQTDPYTTILIDTVDFGAVGTFNTDDNGLEYDENNRIRSVRNPFKIHVDKDTPNDYYIILNITITANNGLDPDDNSLYIFDEQTIVLTVRSGKELPRIIESDMTLTSDTFWIIPNATLIPAGVTVNVEPGTQIQFWSNDPEDVYADLAIAYLKVEGKLNILGTQENPVKLFPSQLKAAYPVVIFSGTYDWWRIYNGFEANNNIVIRYADIINPNIGANIIDHSIFRQNYNYIMQRYIENGEVRTIPYYGTTVRARYISNSIFRRLGSTERRLFWVSDYFVVDGVLEGNLFDSCYMQPTASEATNNVFLNNFILEETQWGDRTYFVSSSYNMGTLFSSADWLTNFSIIRNSSTGTTYVKFNMNLNTNIPQLAAAKNFAKSLGGHLIDINSSSEEQFVLSWAGTSFYLGMEFDAVNGYRWMSGAPVDYTNWSTNYSSTNHTVVSYVWDQRWAPGYTHYPSTFIIEIPGQVLLEDIIVYDSEIRMAENGDPYMIDFMLYPLTADIGTVQFIIDNPLIATVSNDGIVSPVSVGQTTVRVTNHDGTISKTIPVIVTEYIGVTNFTISLTNQNLKVGEVRKVAVSYDPVDTTQKTILWTSSNPGTVSVDRNGNITALSGGNATITAKTPNGTIEKTIQVSVTELANKVSFPETFLIAQLNEPSEVLTPLVEPFTATNKKIHFESSNDNIAYVNEAGELIKVAKGTVIIRATADETDVFGEIIVSIVDTPINQETAIEVTSTLYNNQTRFFALMSNGSVWTWGVNDIIPKKLNVQNIVQISAYQSNLIMLDSAGRVYYQRWVNDIISLTMLSNISRVKKVLASDNWFAILTQDGAVWGLGQNYYGQLGLTGYGNWDNPLFQVDELDNVKDLAVSGSGTFILFNNGTVKYLGYSNSGNVTTPKTMEGVSNVSRMDNYGWGEVAVVSATGDLKILSYNGNPYSIVNRNDIQTVSRGQSHTLVLLKNKTILVNGENGSGQLGIRNFENDYSFTRTTFGLTNVKSIHAGYNVSAAVLEDGKVYVWGNNDRGQLGDLTTTNSNIPIRVNFGLAQDNSPIEVVQANPTHNAEYVDVASDIVVEYNQAIKRSTQYGFIQLVDSKGQLVAIEKIVKLNKLIIRPINLLEGEEMYTLTVPANSFKGLFGQINTVYQAAFTTAPGNLYVKNIVINEQNIQISNNGQPYQIDYTLTPSLVDYTYVRWSSSDATVVTVDEFGVITPVGVGSATVTVVDNNGMITRSVNVSVLNYIALVDFTLPFSQWAMNSGQVKVIEPTFTPEDTTERNLVWTSSNPLVASIDRYGNLTGLAGGTTTITVQNQDGTILRQIDVSVQQSVTSLSYADLFYATDLTTEEAMPLPLINPSTASNQSLTWLSSDPSVAYVNALGQLIKLKVGNAVIRATSQSNPNAFAEIMVSVSNHDIHNLKFIKLGFLSYSGENFYGLASDGSVWTWGYYNPLAIKLDIEPIQDMDIEYGNIILLAKSGAIYYQRYLSSNFNFTKLTSIPNVVKIAAGQDHFLALTSQGKVWGWGYNGYGSLGSINIGSEISPIELPYLSDIKDISAGAGSSYFLNNSGDVRYLGRSNDSEKPNFTIPQVISNQKYVSLSVSGFRGDIPTYGLTTDGKHYAIGPNFETEFTELTQPIRMVYHTGNFRLVVLQNGDVYGADNGDYGQFGNTVGAYFSQFVKIPGLSDIVSVIGGNFTTVALDANGVIYALGRNNQNQLGRFTFGSSPIAKPVYFGVTANNTPISLVQSNPVQGEELFKVDGEIVLTFNKAIKEGPYYPYLRLVDQHGTFIPVERTIVLNKLYIRPLADLDYDTEYRLEIAENALTDLFNTTSSYSLITFTTEPLEFYVRSITLPKTEVSISNNGLFYSIEHIVKPSVLDHTYLTWSSSNPAVATVDAFGRVMPISAGITVVSVSSIDGLITKNITISVLEYIPMEGMQFTEESRIAFTGTVIKINVVFNPTNTTEKQLTWSSNNPSIATVNQQGFVTLLTGGTVVIRAVDNTGVFSDEITLHVQEPVTYVKFADRFMVTTLGGDNPLMMVNVGPETASNKTLIWESSNPEVAYVNQAGQLIRLKDGLAVIRATAENTNVYDEIIVSVNLEALGSTRVKEVAMVGHYDEHRQVYTLMEDGSLWLWSGSSLLPTKTNLTNVVDIDASYGYNRFIALDSTGRVYIDGINNSISSLPSIRKVTVGYYVYLAISTDGHVWGTGSNTSGQLGAINLGNWVDWIQVEGVSNVNDAVAGQSTSLYLLNDGTVQVMGQIYTAGTYMNRTTPITIQGLSNITKISRNKDTHDEYIAYSQDGTTYLISPHSSQIVNVLNEVSHIQQVVSGYSHRLYLDKFGQVFSQGNNPYGQTGFNPSNSNQSLTKIEGLPEIAYVYAGRNTSFAVSTTGELYAWGRNDRYQLANLTTVDNFKPTKIHFGLAIDLSPITIQKTTPANGEEFFTLGQPIVIEFNKAVKPTNQAAYIRLIDQRGNFVNTTREYVLNRLVITPTTPLNPEENYTISIPNGALVDLFGQTMSAISLNFKTQPLVPYVKDIILPNTSYTISTQDQNIPISYSLTPSQLVDASYIEWISSNTNVVTVNAAGIINPVGIGSATITVSTKDGRISKAIQINVIEFVAMTDLTIESESISMWMGTVRQVPVSFNPINTTETRLIWSSSDPSVAKVDANGFVTGLKVGTATITATSSNGQFTDSIVVSVNQAVTSISFKEHYFIQTLDEPQAKIPLQINPLSADSYTLIWESSNPDIAYVNEEGYLVKLALGNVIIRASIADTTLADEIIVSITNIPFANLKVKELAVNRNQQSDIYALMEDGSVWVWASTRSVPIQLNVTGIVDIAAGGSRVIMLSANGTIYYTIGRVYNNDSSTSMDVITSLTDIIKVVVGQDHYLALTSDGYVWGWGYNGYGELGATSNQNVSLRLIYSGGDAIDIAAAAYSTLILRSNGTLIYSGYNNNNNHKVLAPINNMTQVVSIQSFNYYEYEIIKSDGSVFLFRNDAYVFDNTATLINLPSNVRVKSVGINLYSGQRFYLGTDHKIYGNVPDKVKELINVESIHSTYYAQYAKTSDGMVYAWGTNRYGELGYKLDESTDAPKQIFFGIYLDSVYNEVSTTSPVNQATNVSVHEPIIVSFSTIGSLSSGYQNIKLMTFDGKFVPATISTKLNQIIIQPLSPLKYATTYTVQIPHNTLLDLKDFPNGSYQFQFTTEAAPAEISSTPGGFHIWTLEDVISKANEFKKTGMSSGIINNAILNNIIDPNTDTWMRFIAYSGDYYKYLTFNYWGTVDSFLIGKQIRDYEDYPDLYKIAYEPFLTVAPETAYPFVTDVYLQTDLEERTRIVGIGSQTFTVTFNRDMDMTQALEVYFGPDYPYTDYKVDGVWVNARTWRGTFNITPLTGDGKQYFRIRGSRAASDHWLTLGDDDGRFMFEIITSGAESMNLQATGAEGRVILTWMQDDFELLAGYDIYRASSPDGNYVKINTSIVPKDEKTYSDYNVQPGVIYYYRFTVVKTDLTSSDFSNIAAAAAYDTVPPVLYHTPVRSVNLNTDLVITAQAMDNIGITSIHLFYRAIGETNYRSVDLIKGQSYQYSSRIYIDDKYIAGIEYYIEASDDLTTVSSGSSTSPHSVSVRDIPTVSSVSPARGNVSGGQTVTISGSNFKSGAIVYFGGIQGLSITYIDANTLSAVVPAHYPSFVNVKVVNPTGDDSILANGYEYFSSATQLQVPLVKGMVGQEILIPVHLNNVSGLISAEFRFDYNATVLQYVGFVKGTIATRFTTVINASTTGQVRVAMASDINVSGSGDLIYLKFKVLTKPVGEVELALTNASLNGDSIQVETISGKFMEDIVYTISGTFVYYASQEKIQNVRIVLEGEKQYIAITNSNGSYTLQEIEPGSYTLKFEKKDEVGAITAYDASLVLRKSAGLDLLSEHQMIAGDVNGDGKVNSFDAALILQFAAGLRVLPFEGRTNIWHFTSNNIELPNLSQNIANQNITAILIGDVSGNYSQTQMNNLVNVIRVEAIQLQQESKTIFVPVGVITQEEAIYSIEANIKFDPSLQVSEFIFSSELDNYFKVVNTNTPGMIRIVVAGIDPIRTTQSFVTIKFTTTEFKQETYYFNITQTRFNENEAIEMIRNAVNTVYHPDLNNDGILDEQDVQYLLQFINITHQQADISGLDYNNDGIVDIFDIIAREKMN